MHAAYIRSKVVADFSVAASRRRQHSAHILRSYHHVHGPPSSGLGASAAKRSSSGTSDSGMSTFRIESDKEVGQVRYSST